jgi:hypothetical protein
MMDDALCLGCGETPKGPHCSMNIPKAAVFVAGEICLTRANLHNLLVIRIQASAGFQSSWHAQSRAGRDQQLPTR